MKICGIIAEYNPFHNGHKYQIDEIKKQIKDCHVVAVMSGSFCQRGDVAIISKFRRAEMAIKNGCDLVIELPTAFSLSSAADFAMGGVKILDLIGAEYLCFGSEIGDIKLLKGISDKTKMLENSEELKLNLSKGISYPQAFFKASESIMSKKELDVLSMPNNILGIEYISAIQKLNSNIKPITVKRMCAEHDSKVASENVASASYIREKIVGDELSEITKFIPENVYDILSEDKKNNLLPSTMKNLEDIILYKLRNMTEKEIQKINGVSEGLENKIIAVTNSSATLEEVYNGVKSKRFTLAKIRRIIANVLLDIKSEETKKDFNYIRILGMNSNGMSILKALKSSGLNIGTNYTDLRATENSHLIDIDERATDMYSLATPVIQKKGLDYTTQIYVEK